MKLWAKLDEDNIVVEIVREKEDSDRETVVLGTKDTSLPVEVKQGLVRTFPPEEGPTGSYASIGFKYDPELKGFVPPATSSTDIFDPKTFTWLPAKPDQKNEYYWDDTKQAWILVAK